MKNISKFTDKVAAKDPTKQYAEDQRFEETQRRSREQEAKSQSSSQSGSSKAEEAPPPTDAATESAAMKTLGLNAGYTALDLRKAYRKAALASHPDKVKDGGVKFVEVSDAFELLKKVLVSRNEWDQTPES